MESLVEEEVQLDGAQVTATLRYSGVLQWHGKTKQGCLVVQDDVIGIKRGELSITLYTFCMSSKSTICGGFIRKRRRKDLRLSFANDASQQLWFENIQVFLDEAGNSRSRSLSLSLCLSLFCNMMRNGRRGSQNRFEPSYL